MQKKTAISLRRLIRQALVASTCAYTRAIDLSSRAGYRSIFVLTSLANTCTGQSERRSPPAPIRTPEWSSRISGQLRILFTEPPSNNNQKAVFSPIHFPASFIRLWPSCHSDLGDRDMAGDCSYNKPNSYIGEHEKTNPGLTTCALLKSITYLPTHSRPASKGRTPTSMISR